MKNLISGNRRGKRKKCGGGRGRSEGAGGGLEKRENMREEDKLKEEEEGPE